MGTRRRGKWLLWALVAVLPLLSLMSPIAVRAALEYNETLTLEDDFDSCTGETIRFTGTQHIVSRLTTDRAGGQHFSFTRNTHGTGVSSTSGAQYVLSDAYTRAGFDVTSGEETTFTQQYSTRLIQKGEQESDDDLIVHFVERITVTAEGEVLSDVKVERVECK